MSSCHIIFLLLLLLLQLCKGYHDVHTVTHSDLYVRIIMVVMNSGSDFLWFRLFVVILWRPLAILAALLAPVISHLQSRLLWSLESLIFLSQSQGMCFFLLHAFSPKSSLCVLMDSVTRCCFLSTDGVRK